MSTWDDLLKDLNDTKMSLSLILRKAYPLVRSYGEPELAAWLESELFGYDLDDWEHRGGFPPYRQPSGRLLGRDMAGRELPIQFPDVGNLKETEEKLSAPPLPYSIADIEDIIRNHASVGRVHMSLHPRNATAVREGLGNMTIEPRIEYPLTSFSAIVNGVRDTLYKRIVELKERSEDKQRAAGSEEGEMVPASQNDMGLNSDQKELLIDMVDAQLSLPKKEQCPFVVIQAFREGHTLVHPSFESGYSLHKADLDSLQEATLLRFTYATRGNLQVDITNKGYAYYKKISTAHSPLVAIEAETRRFLESKRFRDRYPAAYQRIKQAEAKLWDSALQDKVTEVGHNCREALQEFAATLLQLYGPPDCQISKTSTKNALSAVVDHNKERLGKTVSGFLPALVSYWFNLIDLVERQEHAGLKDGEPLGKLDARRVVYQTMNIMYELESTLSQ